MKAIKRDGEVVAYLDTARVVAIHALIGEVDESAVFLDGGAAVRFQGTVVEVVELLGLTGGEVTEPLTPQQSIAREMLRDMLAKWQTRARNVITSADEWDEINARDEEVAAIISDLDTVHWVARHATEAQSKAATAAYLRDLQTEPVPTGEADACTR